VRRARAPTHANLDYAPPEPATSNGHKLDLYIPAGAAGPLPVVIWTGGSAWMADTGNRMAGGLAAQLNPGRLRGWQASRFRSSFAGALPAGTGHIKLAISSVPACECGQDTLRPKPLAHP